MKTLVGEPECACAMDSLGEAYEKVSRRNSDLVKANRRLANENATMTKELTNSRKSCSTLRSKVKECEDLIKSKEKTIDSIERQICRYEFVNHDFLYNDWRVISYFMEFSQIFILFFFLLMST